MDVEVLCLGTGTSHGVPMIGCDCEVCTSSDACDRRSRPAITVSFGGRTVLIDTPQELRLQCVACGVRRVDAVLFTHHHADHVSGLDDLRRFNWISGAALDCYGMPATMRRLREMFAYAFEQDDSYPSHKPELRLNAIDDCPLSLLGETVLPIPLWHGSMPVLGYRFGRFAYCTDCNRIPDESMQRLQDLDVLILDALRYRPHPTHFSLAEAVETARRIGARQTYFTHIAHELKHDWVNAELPEGMRLAHDGLRFRVAS